MTQDMILLTIRPKYYKDEEKLFLEIKEKINLFGYSSFSEPHTLVWFSTGTDMSDYDIDIHKKEIGKKMEKIHKKFEFTCLLMVFKEKESKFI